MSELDELIQDAEDKREEFSEAQKKAKQVKDDLRKKVRELSEEEILDASELDKALHQIDEAEYGKVRETIREAQQGTSFEFEDEEKQAFAEGFKESIEELQDSVEQVRNELMTLSDSVDREKQIRYIYGSTSMNLSEVEKIFDVINDFTRSGVDSEKMARALRGYNGSLKLSDTEKVLEIIQNEADE